MRAVNSGMLMMAKLLLWPMPKSNMRSNPTVMFSTWLGYDLACSVVAAGCATTHVIASFTASADSSALLVVAST